MAWLPTLLLMLHACIQLSSILHQSQILDMKTRAFLKSTLYDIFLFCCIDVESTPPLALLLLYASRL